MSMYFQYGNHRHPNDEVNLTALEVTTKYSPRGTREASRYRLHLSGELIYTGQAALAPKIAELIDAYAVENQTGALYHTDGTVTRHRIESSSVNANNISGVKVAYRSWPKGEPEEYATTRSFYIILECEYRDLESELIEYHDAVRITGNAGPCLRVTEYANRLARVEQTKRFTAQQIVQEGRAVGYDGYPIGFIPGPIHPTLNIPDLAIIEHAAPQFRGAAFTHYTSSWRYVMMSTTNVGGFPVTI